MGNNKRRRKLWDEISKDGKYFAFEEKNSENLLLKKENERLKEFARHTSLCRVIGGYSGPCDCGLDEILKGE